MSVRIVSAPRRAPVSRRQQSELGFLGINTPRGFLGTGMLSGDVPSDRDAPSDRRDPPSGAGDYWNPPGDVPDYQAPDYGEELRQAQTQARRAQQRQQAYRQQLYAQRQIYAQRQQGAGQQKMLMYAAGGAAVLGVLYVATKNN